MGDIEIIRECKEALLKANTLMTNLGVLMVKTKRVIEGSLARLDKMEKENGEIQQGIGKQSE